MSTQHVIICLSLLFSYYSCSDCSQKKNNSVGAKQKRKGFVRDERQGYDYDHREYSYTPSLTVQKLHRVHGKPLEAQAPQNIDDLSIMNRQRSCLDVNRSEGQPMTWYMRLWACCCRIK